MRDSLKYSKPTFDMSQLIEAARLQASGSDERPVDKWKPDFCGEMDMVIKSDGTWWHDGSMITRMPLVKLFASILRKDEDGVTYLVTPAEKIAIRVDKGHFLATQLHADKDEAGQQRLVFTTNIDEVIALGPERPLRVLTDTQTLEPTPLLSVRGRLEALLSRSVFYELLDYASERETPEGLQLGVESGGAFFPLGPANIHTGGVPEVEG